MAIDRTNPSIILLLGTGGTGKSSRPEQCSMVRKRAIGIEDKIGDVPSGLAAGLFIAEGATRLFDSARSASDDAMSALEPMASRTSGAPSSLTAQVGYRMISDEHSVDDDVRTF